MYCVYTFVCTDKTNQVPNWNFWKYLVSHEGEVLGAWSPRTDVTEIMTDIVSATRVATTADGSQPTKPGNAETPKHDDL